MRRMPLPVSTWLLGDADDARRAGAPLALPYSSCL
jgi:hypothetical protein